MEIESIGSSKTMLKYQSSEYWRRINPVLRIGVIALETDTGNVKFGNGKDHYNDLSYSGGGSGGSQIKIKENVMVIS